MLNDESVGGTETQKQYLERLKKTALGLPRDYVKKVLAKMKPHIEATVAREDKHISTE